MILVVDNNEKTQQEIRECLRRSGFYSFGTNSLEVMTYLLTGRISVVLISPIRPYHKMENICSEIRQFDKSIVIICIIGFDCGEGALEACRKCTDYKITLPFSTKEFICLMNDIMKQRADITHNTSRHGRLYINTSPREVYVCGKELILTDSEFSILHLLSTYYPHSFFSSEILDCCFSSNLKLGVGNIATHISAVNKKSRAACSCNIIKNIRKKGYTLNILP